MENTDNRRRFGRVQLESLVRVNFPGTEARRQLLLDNLSAGGLFIRTDQPKPIGTKLRFEFHVRDGGSEIIGTGVVRWVEVREGQPVGMGIKFLELNEEGRREIASILAGRKK